MSNKIEIKVKLIEKNYSLLDSTILQMLLDHNIVTVDQFLNENIDELVKITGLKYQDILTTKKEIVDQCTNQYLNGFEYYKILSLNGYLIPTGIQKLDKLLEGGLHKGNILELCGKTCTGKTQIFYSLAVNLSQQYNQSVYYIDTKSDFKIERLVTILLARNYKIEDAAPKIKQHILVEVVLNVFDLISSLEALQEEIPNKWKNIRVLVIDSFSALFLPLTIEESRFGILNHIIGLLRRIAKSNLITVIIINSIYPKFHSNYDSNEVIVSELGQYWYSIPNTTLLIKTTSSSLNNEEHNIEVLKSSRLEKGINTNVIINEQGVL